MTYGEIQTVVNKLIETEDKIAEGINEGKEMENVTDEQMEMGK